MKSLKKVASCKIDLSDYPESHRTAVSHTENEHPDIGKGKFFPRIMKPPTKGDEEVRDIQMEAIDKTDEPINQSTSVDFDKLMELLDGR